MNPVTINSPTSPNASSTPLKPHIPKITMVFADKLISNKTSKPDLLEIIRTLNEQNASLQDQLHINNQPNTHIPNPPKTHEPQPHMLRENANLVKGYMSKIPTFDGEDTGLSFMNFTHNAQLYYNAAFNTPHHDKLNYITSHFGPYLKQWWLSINLPPHPTPFHSWDDFTQALLGKIARPMDYATNLNKLMNLRQTKSVKEYVAESRFLHRILPGLPEEVKLTHFENGLSKSISTALLPF
jgi:Retrotransposon gag protein